MDKDNTGEKQMYIFISHDIDLFHEDVRPIVEELEDSGIACWVCERDISSFEDWNTALMRAVRDSSCLLLLASEQSVLSHQVAKEVAWADKFAIPIVVYYLEDVQLPDNIMFMAGMMQHIAYSAETDPSFKKIKEAFASTGKNAKTNALAIPEKTTANNHSVFIRQESTYQKEFREAITLALSHNSERNRGITILDIGFRDCGLVKARIESLNIVIDRYIAICESSRKSEDFSDFTVGEIPFEFCYINLSGDTVSNDILDITGSHCIDLIYSDGRYRQITDLKAFLRFAYRELLARTGSIVLKAFDDGSKFCYPDKQHVLDSIVRETAKLPFITDRYMGRKLYSFLYNAGFRTIDILYKPNDTSTMDCDARVDLFHESFSYRLDYFETLKRNNPGSAHAQNKYRKMEKLLAELEDLFWREDFFYFEANMYVVAKRG